MVKTHGFRLRFPLFAVPRMCRALVWHTVTLADHVSLVAEPLFTLYRPDGAMDQARLWGLRGRSTSGSTQTDVENP